MRSWICILGLLFLSTAVMGQRYKKQPYLQIGSGFSDTGPLLSAYYVYNFQYNLSGISGMAVTHGGVADLRLTTIYGDAAGTYLLWKKGTTIYLNAMLGMGMAIDVLNEFETSSVDKRSFASFGVLAGPEIEMILSRNTELVAYAQQRHYFSDSYDALSRWRFQLGIGLRIKI